MAARRSHGASSWSGLLFIAPFLLCYLVLLAWPLLHGLWLSLHAIDLLSNLGRWVGAVNFVDLLQDEMFVRSAGNTVLFAALCTPAMVITGLALALALNRPGRATAILRGVFFGAGVLSVTIVTLVWRLVLMPERGMLANFAHGVGLDSGAPLTNEWLALPMVALATVWWGIGMPMMLFLASLQQIPQDVYEAAALDNTSRWRSFRHITLPAIRHSVVLVAVTQLIAQLQVFGQVQLLTQGGPNNSTRSLVMFVYEAMFEQWQLGYAAAGAQALFLLMLVGMSLQGWLERRAGKVSS
ncbi:ABC transporter permease subunit [Duganella sp. FT80W]|uniref:ABC transporter permease subunit n=2 Tax=Duganella guangzhouensis TaxID=2666084 RepID=A0A6I2L3M5_9BURK|nr:ABC transporter permease subunit [Duganella guangzhouensis]